MRKDIVSIVVPCYNGEQFVGQFCDTIIKQTYKNIQLIIVNDGSTDETEKELKKYEDELESVLTEYIYVKKENGGQASAINAGLKYVNGEYLMWIDIDDLMHPYHVEKKKNYLEMHPDCDIVRCQGYEFGENDFQNPIAVMGDEEVVGTLFEDILLGQRTCIPGLYMVKTEKLFEVLTDRTIYEARKSQNNQLLLPITLADNVGFIEDKLFYYNVRSTSYSHSWRGGLRMRTRWDNIYDIKMHVLQELPLTEEYFEFLVRQLELCYLRYRLICIDEEIIAADECYAAQVCMDYIGFGNVIDMVGGRKVFMWGFCDFSKKVMENLERFTPLTFDGYIESDFEKASAEKEEIVLHRSEINKDEMYVIIPLRYHEDIVALLKEKGFEEGVDYYYPMEKLREEFVGEKIRS